MARPRKSGSTLPPCVRERHGAYHYFKPGFSRKLCRVEDGVEVMYEALATLLREHADKPEEKGMPRLCREWKKAPGEFGLQKYRPKVKKEYERMLDHIAHWFANFDVHQVKTHHVAKVLDTKFHNKPRTANAYRALLSLLFKYAIRYNKATTNPCAAELLSGMRESKRSRYIDDSEVERIKLAGGARLGLFIDLAIITGQRVGDLIAMNWSQVSDKGITLTQSKEGARVAIAMTDQLRATLDGLRGNVTRFPTSPVLTTQTGDRYTYSGLHSAWKRACEKAGVTNAHIHDLRRKALTDATNQMGKEAAQALAGHKSPEMTAHYYEHTQEVWVQPVRVK